MNRFTQPFISLHENMKITMPLFVMTWIKKPKRQTIALNQYRNRHYLVSNNIKKLYKEEVKKKLSLLWKIELATPISITFTYFNPTKRRSDLENFCAVHNKFFQDALVELWYIEDDNYDFVQKIEYIYWGYQKDQWRVEIEVKKL